MNSGEEHDAIATASPYTDAARARLAMAQEACALADLARAAVPIGAHEPHPDGAPHSPGSVLADAAHVLRAAHRFFEAAAVCERLGGASWQAIGDAAGVDARTARHASPRPSPVSGRNCGPPKVPQPPAPTVWAGGGPTRREIRWKRPATSTTGSCATRTETRSGTATSAPRRSPAAWSAARPGAELATQAVVDAPSRVRTGPPHPRRALPRPTLRQRICRHPQLTPPGPTPPHPTASTPFD